MVSKIIYKVCNGLILLFIIVSLVTTGKFECSLMVGIGLALIFFSHMLE